MIKSSNYSDQDDEIDLTALMRTLWSEKIRIFLFIFLALMIGGSYAFFSTPRYDVELRFLPPSYPDVVELHKLSEVKAAVKADFSTSHVFDQFTQVIQSERLHNMIVGPSSMTESSAGDSLPVNKEKENHNGSIIVRNPSKKSPYISVVVSASEAGKAVQFAKQLSALATEKTVDQLIFYHDEVLQDSKNRIKTALKNKRVTYMAQMKMELQKLQEAQKIASSIGLQERDTDSDLDSGNKTLMIDEMRRLYRAGTVAITAEIEYMQARIEDQSLMLPSMVNLQQQLVYLNSISVEASKIRPAILDTEIVKPSEPVKPKKVLILLLSIILGGVAGVMFILIRGSLGKL